jgi:hypothetical protein
MTEGYLIIDTIPRPFYRITRNVQWQLDKRGMKREEYYPAIRKHMDYKDAVRAVAAAQRFRISGAIKLVFIIQFPPTMKAPNRFKKTGEYYSTPKQIYKLHELIEGFVQCYPDNLIGRVDAAVYWGDKFRVMVKNITTDEHDYIRQGFL